MYSERLVAGFLCVYFRVFWQTLSMRNILGYT